MDTTFRTKMRAVTIYLKGGTLKETAARYGIHRTTLTRWKKWYKEGGAENIRKHSYKKPWNRFSKEFEERVMYLKENNPSLTVRKAREVLGKEGIFISLRGIHSIWKRFNLIKRPPDDSLSPFGPLTSESKYAIEYVKNLLADKQNPDAVRVAAQVLNSLPSYPADREDILKEIPEKFLSPRRKLDRLYSCIMKIPAPDFYKKIKNIRKSLERNGYFYSATIAGLLEILALRWMHIPEEELRLTKTLKERTIGLYDPVVRFQLAHSSATAYAQLLQVKNAFESAKQCRKILNSLRSSSALEYYGVLMTSLTDYKKSLHFFLMALEKATDEGSRKRLLCRIGFAHMMAGEYQEARKILTNKLRVKHQGISWPGFMSSLANMYFASGEFERAAKCLQELLQKSRSEQLRNSVYSAILCHSSITAALGKINESKMILKGCIPMLDKYKLQWEITTVKYLIKRQLPEKKAQRPPYINHIHFLYLLDRARKTFRYSDYQIALKFAQRKGLVNFLHRLIVFFPEIIAHRIQKGQTTGLPVSVLRFPVFNRNVPVYHVKFLGNVVCYINRKHKKIRLTAQQRAFLIHSASRMGEPGKSISISDLNNNFWLKSRKPSKRLNRMLAALRQNLHIPRHRLCISSRGGDRRLINKGFYITTDYSDYRNALTRARALERAGEFAFSRECYLQTFKLIRGAPFRKMFDNWSEDMRTIIFNQIENTTLRFAEFCKAYGDGKDATRILQKISKIIPSSKEIKRLLTI